MLTPGPEFSTFVMRRGCRRFLVVLILLSLQAALAASQEEIKPGENHPPGEGEKPGHPTPPSGKTLSPTADKALWLLKHPGSTEADYEFWKRHGRLPVGSEAKGYGTNSDTGVRGLRTESFEQWHLNHPKRTEADYEFWKEQGRLPKVGEIDSFGLGHSRKTYTVLRMAPAPTRAEVEATGADLLRTPYARGWGFVGYASDPPATMPEEVRVTAGFSTREEVDKFLIVDTSHRPGLGGLGLDSLNTISVGGNELQNEDLINFFQVNNRFLRDLPATAASAANRSPVFPTLRGSSTIVATSARLPSGKEVLTVFDLSDSAQTGTQRGVLYTVEPGSIGLEIGLRLGDKIPRKIILYGPLPTKIDLPKLCEDAGHQLILRSAEAPRNLVETEARLQQLENRKFDEAQLTVVDGLPQDENAVRAMGLFAGSTEAWLDFHKKIDDSLQWRGNHRIATREEFLNELSRGHSDLLILVAHSTGSDLYLNGNKISIEDLKAMAPRTEKWSRPRLAVLVACDAGRTTSTVPETWWSRVTGPRAALAQILVDKGFVDMVIAPDHKIRADESLAAFRHALEPNLVRWLLSHWYRFAVDWSHRLEQNKGERS
jgi:hypothetical protein